MGEEEEGVSDLLEGAHADGVAGDAEGLLAPLELVEEGSKMAASSE